MATTASSGMVKSEPNPYSTQAGPTSPTSSLKTNVSSTLPATESTHSHPYHPFPSQAARIPSQTHLTTSQEPLPTTTPDPRAELSAVASASSIMLVPTENWSVEGFRDRHLSASEPRIFPGVVSRHQRRASSSRVEEGDGGLVMWKKGSSSGPSTGTGKGAAGLNGAVEESSDEDG
jgi:AMP deaminase